MPMQDNRASSRNGSAALPPDNLRSPREAAAEADAEGAPLPTSMLVPQDSRPRVAEPMNDHDQALQYDLVQLLSTLEHHRARLDKAFHQGEPVEVLDLARAMVDEVVELAERLGTGGDSTALTTALADAGNLYTNLDRLRQDLNPSLVRSVLFLFGKSRTSPEQKRQNFRQTLTDTFRVIETFLGLFRAELQSEAAAQEWGQASGLFLHDLGRVVVKVNS
jgi:hypothetical protein